MEWIKFYTGKWLYGSGRAMTPEQRGVWADLLALAGETKLRDGALRFDVGQPMGRDYIANILRIPLQLLNECLSLFECDANTDDGKPRVGYLEDGTIVLTNFAHYQDVPANKKKLRTTPEEAQHRDIMNTSKLTRQHPEVAARTLQEQGLLRYTNLEVKDGGNNG